MMARDKTDKTDKTPVALNEWGVPDWRDEEAYGETSGWTLDRWRWEFFRRREDLRKCFDDHAEAEYQSNQRLLNDPTILINCFGGKPSEPGFTVSVVNSRKHFDYVSIPNPRIGCQPAGILKPWKSYRTGNVINGNVRDLSESIPEQDLNESISKQEVIEIVCEQLESQLPSTRPSYTQEQGSFTNLSPINFFEMPLEQHQVAIKFDLDQPLEPQMKKVREVLRSQQKKIHGKLIQTRRHTTKWLQYLRSLDAREAGATWSEIAALHVETMQSEQTGRDKWAQARALCFNFDF
ncbi:hypothetical protein [Pseudogemmobacter sp. W21_MBD1_M6]|uniref:hypothetical protein n=1 Tax=Pseudogemmobacter sp. W21_MBD1_M6 TaxID=3240271 RepID=UPI003F94A988